MSQDTIDKLDECVKLRNNQLSITGSTINKQDVIVEMINEYYYKLQGQTNDVDTVNKINQFIDDGLESKLSNVEKKIDMIAFNETRLNKLMEIFMRVSIGSEEERLNKLAGTWNQGYGSASSYEQAKEIYNNWMNEIFLTSCPVVEAVDTILYNDENEKN